jgi:hypothetical protein
MLNVHQQVEGRRNPSVSKMQYTLYLGDCEQSASQAIRSAMELLSAISEYSSPRFSLDPSLLDWCKIIKADLEYIQGRLDELKARLIELRVMVIGRPFVAAPQLI